MHRILPSLLALSAAILFAAPALAADFNDFSGDSGDQGDSSALRSGYPTEPGDWAGLGDKDDPLAFEFGLRYWYSMGASNWSDGAGGFGSTDTSHVLEGHLRIEDHSTNTFVTAVGGYSIASFGSFSDPFTSGSISEGHIGYLGADIGWNPWGDNKGSGVGAVLGYMYYNDQLLTTRANFTTAQPGDTLSFDPTSGQVALPGFDSSPNDININMLRMGMSAKADMGFMDVTGTLAAIPYASVNGVIGGDQVSPTFTPVLHNLDVVKGSATDVNGWGYGAAADLMLRAHPTKNITIGIGGRAWYLQGTTDASFDLVQIGDPHLNAGTPPPVYDAAPVITRQRVIELANPFSMMRYGLTAELTYAF